MSKQWLPVKTPSFCSCLRAQQMGFSSSVSTAEGQLPMSRKNSVKMCLQASTVWLLVTTKAQMSMRLHSVLPLRMPTRNYLCWVGRSLMMLKVRSKPTYWPNQWQSCFILGVTMSRMLGRWGFLVSTKWMDLWLGQQCQTEGRSGSKERAQCLLFILSRCCLSASRMLEGAQAYSNWFSSHQWKNSLRVISYSELILRVMALNSVSVMPYLSAASRSRVIMVHQMGRLLRYSSTVMEGSCFSCLTLSTLRQQGQSLQTLGASLAVFMKTSLIFLGSLVCTWQFLKAMSLYSCSKDWFLKQTSLWEQNLQCATSLTYSNPWMQVQKRGKVNSYSQRMSGLFLQAFRNLIASTSMRSNTVRTVSSPSLEGGKMKMSELWYFFSFFIIEDFVFIVHQGR